MLATSLLVALVLGSTPAQACKCITPKTGALRSAQADAVFLGTVEGIRDSLKPGGGQVAHFEVEEAFKGVRTRRVQVTTGRSSCHTSFTEGERYFVYAYGDDLTASRCNNPTPFAHADSDELSWMGSGTTDLIDRPRRGWVLGGGAAVILFGIGFVWGRRD